MTDKGLGRIGLLESGAVIIGSVEERICIITENDEELKEEIAKYSKIVCAGVMNTMFNGKRFADWLLESYTEAEIEEKFIFYYYVKYYSKINRYITFKNIFYGEEEIQKTGRLIREIRIWNTDEIEAWLTGIKGILGKLTTISVIDFIKSTSENEVYESILEFNGIEDKGRIENEMSLNSLWAQNTKYGEVIKAYRTRGNEFILERMTENNIDDYLSFISLSGTLNKIRYTISREKGRDIAKDGTIAVGDFNFRRLTGSNAETASKYLQKYNEITEYGYTKSIYEVVSKLRKEVNGLMLYQISTSTLTLVIRRNTDTPEILKKIYQIISESELRKTYDTVAVGERQSTLDTVDKDKTNMIQFEKLANIDNVELCNEKDIRNTVCGLFEELKQT